MSKIRIGHIGTYHDHSIGKLECIRKYPDIFEVVGVTAESEKRKREIAHIPAYRGLDFVSEEALFEKYKPDAVLIEGYELALLDIAERCVRRGVHIHMDKPAGDGLHKFESILNMAKEKNLIFQMAYMYRYNNAVRKCMELYKAGKLGELTGIDAYMCTEHSGEKNKWLENFKGGIMFFLGCHMLDLVYLFAGKPNNLCMFNKSTGLSGTRSEDNCFAALEYDKFTAAVRMNSTEVNGYGRRQLVVAGSLGTVEIKPLENPTKMYVSYKSMTKENIYSDIREEYVLSPQLGRYDEMMLDFAAFVRGERKNPYSYEYELGLQKLVLQACGIEK